MTLKTDWIDGDILYADDLNDNFGYIMQTTRNEIMQNSLDILELQAEATLEGGQSAYMVRDIFSDADGYLDTVDTGNTTAIFQTDIDIYENYVYTTTNGDFMSSMTAAASGTHKYGAKIEIGDDDILIKSINKWTSDSEATKAYVLDESENVLVQANFSSNNATFSSPYRLSKNTIYYIATDDGSTNRRFARQEVTFPISRTHFDIISGYNYSPASVICEIDYISYEYVSSGADKIIQTNNLNLDFEPSNFQVFAYKNETGGTGSITADISFDSGTNYQTGVELDTPTTITNEGDELILKLNLNAGDSDGLASCEGYGVMFW
jgi:hypothetical protein